MANQWQLSLKGVDEIVQRVVQLPNQAESIINTALKAGSGDVAMKRIEGKTPISREQLRKGHRHANGSAPYKVTYENLGFIIRPKKKFEYLKYPDLGIGTSKGNAPRQFLRNGLDDATPKIKEQLLAALDAKLMK